MTSSQSDVIMSSVALDMGEKYQDGQFNDQQQSLIREQPPSYKVRSSLLTSSGSGHVMALFQSRDDLVI